METTIKKLIKRLRLREGDILVVPDVETRRRLLRCRPPRPEGVKTSIPVVLAPYGIEHVPLKVLKELIIKIEKEMA